MTLTDGAGNSLLLDGVEGVTGAEGLDEVMLSDTNAATLGIFGVEVALGGTGNDRIHSSNADLTSILIDGGLGNDSLLRGGGGADTIFGGDGVDRLEGQDGNDLLEGGAGADSLLGGDGDDTLIGGGGADRMHGENGDDFIIGGNGDVIFANAGDDFIELDGSVDPDLGRAFIDGNDGIDTVSLVGETNTASVQRIERVIGSAGVDLSLIHI